MALLDKFAMDLAADLDNSNNSNNSNVDIKMDNIGEYDTKTTR